MFTNLFIFFVSLSFLYPVSSRKRIWEGAVQVSSLSVDFRFLEVSRINAWSNSRLKTGMIGRNFVMKRGKTLTENFLLLFSNSSCSFHHHYRQLQLCRKSDDEDDDENTAFFFAQNRKMRQTRAKNNKELDTFSIQEMSIIDSDSNDGDKSSDDGDCDSHLNLQLPERSGESFMEKLKDVLCCSRKTYGMF